MWPFKRRKEEPEKREFDYAAIRIGNVYILPPDEEDIKFFKERLAQERLRKRREKMRLITRRSLLVGGAAAAVGLIALPFLPKGKELNPDDLLKPELAKANPQLMRELCLEFYDHPKAAYRGAAAAHMAEFEDSQVQTVLLSRISIEPIPDVAQALARSIVTHRDPSTYAQIASLYWQKPTIQTSVDALAMAYGLTALQTAITQAKP